MSKLLLRSKIYRFWHPFNPFNTVRSLLQWRVSILLDCRIRIFKFGIKPSILTLENSFALKSNSSSFGNVLELNVYSKSFNLQPFNSNSLTSSQSLPFKFYFNIYYVSLPVKCSLACWCYGLSIDIPSSTFNFFNKNKV